MHIAHVKAIVSGNTGYDFFKCMPAERKVVNDAMQRVEYAKKGSRQVRESMNSWKGQRARGVLPHVPCKLMIGQDVKGGTLCNYDTGAMILPA
jgi:hypothetical protein